MARQNHGRSIGAQANLAERLERELKERGWSPAEFASRITDAGCPIQTSAIYKILSGDPPRRIDVDELHGMAAALGTSVPDLLTPVDVIDDQRARELLNEFTDAEERLYRATADLIHAGYEWFKVKNSDVGEYVMRHMQKAHFDPTFIAKGYEVDDAVAEQAELLRGMAAAEGGRLAIIERDNRVE